MKVVFLAPAEEELLDAARFFESQAKGLGEDFLHEVQGAMLEGVARHSQGGKGNAISRRLVRRFPYGILYRIDGDHIVVLAVKAQ